MIALGVYRLGGAPVQHDYARVMWFAGNRRYVAAMTYSSLAAGAHGIMVEIHPEPEQRATA